ncbi:MAG: hypothetical protein GF334_13275 [Candidatus Altiarchaeales archaeon]|nr:hypothetical protein [Candidatus Altiarchaeales archaeon]
MKISASVARARKCLKKTGKLHLGYKKKMKDVGLRGFVSEFLYGYYSIDEADPFAKVAIEIDACYWHGCESCGFVGDKRIVTIQKRKDTYLRNHGWLVLHIKEHEIKRDPYFRIEQIRELQAQRRELHAEKIRSAMLKGTLCVKGLRSESDNMEWFPVADILRHRTPHKKMYRVTTELGSVVTTEDHSLFLFEGNREVRAKDLHSGDLIVGSFDGHERTPVVVQKVEETIQEEYTYDLSVPGPQNFMLHTGILAHNSYSISGVSLDIEKSSKYESMKNNFIQEYDKAKEEDKRSIKIVKGLKQPRYGIGISSALGPYSRPGVQSRRNYVSGFRGGWA